MGYDDQLVIESVDEKLICSICTMVLKEPVQTRCGHAFCNTCIRNWLAKKSVCPIDGNQLNANDLHPPCGFLRNLLSKLNIRCQYYQSGCLEITRLNDFDEHHATCSLNPNTEVLCDRVCSLNLNSKPCSGSAITSLAATPREKKWFYLSNVIPEPSEAMVKSYICLQMKIDSSKVIVKRLPRRDHDPSASFKIGIDETIDTTAISSIWPESENFVFVPKNENDNQPRWF